MLKVIVGIIKVFVSLFIYIKDSGTVLITRAIIIKVILNFELTNISKLVIAKDLKLTILAKGTINTIVVIKASVFNASF
jgi:hypothetical protein